MFRIKTLILIILPLWAFSQTGDEVYKARLSKIEGAVPLTYNSYVRAHINDYVRNDQKHTSKSLSIFFKYEKEIEEIILSYKLPKELKYMAFSLSGCSNFESSEEGGTGFYLMRYNIAKNKGLHISSYIDERRDVVKSTHAFAKEMLEMEAKYHDWHKAIAAYYAGSLEMDRAISYSKDSLHRYWNAHSYLPFTYQKTVTKYIAARYIVQYYKEHGIVLSPAKKIETDTVPIREHTTFQQISTKLNIEHSLLKELNPIYKKEIIPNSGRDYYLVLPKSKVELFYSLGDSIYIAPEEVKDTVVAEEIVPPPLPAYTTIYYTVRSGDILLNIADYYDTNVSTIKSWNGLRSDRINVNQRLKIVVPTSKLDYYKKINSMAASEKRRIANKD